MSKEKNVMDIKELVPDDHNFNKGTEQGKALMKKSFEELGAGRSILIDKDNRIIAGNKSVQAAIDAGIIKVQVIETDGSELIAVRRTDLDLNTKKGREMAAADNATGQANLDWDKAELASLSDIYDIDMNDWKIRMPNEPKENELPKDEKMLKLKFSPEEYSFVLDALRKHGDDFSYSLLLILKEHEAN